MIRRIALLVVMLTALTTSPVSAAPRAIELGDSITVAMEPFLIPHGVTCYAAVGRQFSTGAAVAQYLAQQHALASRMVIELGTNGPFTQRDLASLIGTLHTARRIVLVENYGARWWIPGNNVRLRVAAAHHPQRVRLVDWPALVAHHPGLVGPDGIHPTDRGASVLSNAIIRALDGT